MKLAVTALAFLACIIGANYLTTEHGMISVGFGLTATAGTLLAGATFVVRDTLQDLGGVRLTAGLIVVGAAISYAISDPFIALASGIAFLASEAADLLIYTPLRQRRGYLPAAITSNTAGALVDTLLFLSIAGFALSAEVVAGQMLGKLYLTAVVVIAVALVVVARRRRTAA